jgi:hypothetical protein
MFFPSAVKSSDIIKKEGIYPKRSYNFPRENQLFLPRRLLMNESNLETENPQAGAPEKQKRRKFRLFLVLGLALALLAMKIFPARPLNEQLLQLSLRQTLGPLADGFAAEPPELQALMLDYAPRPEMVLTDIRQQEKNSYAITTG